MADIPDRIVLKRHRDLAGRRHAIWYRRAALAVLVVFLLLGLLNVFGQRPHGTTLDSDRASLELYAPTHLRGGLLYEARFTFTAKQEVKTAWLQLSPGCNEGQTRTPIEPSPLGESSR